MDGSNILVDYDHVLGGDSGGPWFVGHVAYGTTISFASITFGDGSTATWSCYIPIDRIESVLGVTVLTSEPDCGYTITTNASPVGAGAVSVSLDGTPGCLAGRYAMGAVVTFTAQPNAGYAFDHWTGISPGNLNPTTVIVQGNLNVTAVFRSLPTTTPTSTVPPTVTPTSAVSPTATPTGTRLPTATPTRTPVSSNTPTRTATAPPTATPTTPPSGDLAAPDIRGGQIPSSTDWKLYLNNWNAVMTGGRYVTYITNPPDWQDPDPNAQCLTGAVTQPSSAQPLAPMAACWPRDNNGELPVSCGSRTEARTFDGSGKGSTTTSFTTGPCPPTPHTLHQTAAPGCGLA